MGIRQVTANADASARGHLSNSLRSTLLSTALSAGSSLVRVNLTISALGVLAFGVISTILSLAGWLMLIPAGVRQAASVGTGSDQKAPPAGVAAIVAREAWRMTLPVWVLAVVIVLLAPIDRLIDPSNAISTWGLRLALIAAIVIGAVSVAGSSYLGVSATIGAFRSQNVAVVASVVLVTVLTGIGWVYSWPPTAFAILWCAGLAGPALVVSAWTAHSAWRAQRSTYLRQISKHSIWIAAGQQVASGFDLLIVTAVLGSVAAAEFGLWTRLVLLTGTVMIGAAPVVIRLAGQARASRLPCDRDSCRRVVLVMSAIQAAVVLGLLAVGPTAVAILSGGAISLDGTLLAAGCAWAMLEFARRALMALTGDVTGLKFWHRSALWMAVPNVALSVLLTMWVGVAGPLLASVVAFLVMVTWGALTLREQFIAVVGR